jgi:AraC family transcriptional regulator
MQAKYDYYVESVNMVIDYIDQNIEKQFTLDELSDCANFSKFHFHRIFHDIVGEAPFQYILRVRLERSASIINSNPRKNLTEIASKCGFSSLALFSRNFKKHFHCTPSAFKKVLKHKSNKSQTKRNKQPIEKKPQLYFCKKTKTIKWTSNMDFIKSVEVKKLPKMTVAYNRSFGPYKGNNDLYQKHQDELFSWAASKDLLIRENFKYLILYHDNPKVALNENQRMSLSLTVPPQTKTEGIIGKMEIDEDLYLVCQCELSSEDFPKIWNWIFENWFKHNNYVPLEKPYYELYPEPPTGNLFKVDFCIPVEAA